MGYAVPAAMAAKLAYPDRPVLAVCGDGGFAMSIHALMTAVQEHLPIGVLVFNNGALGWVLHGMGEKAVAAGFDPFDHAAIARSLGCDGVRVESVERPARRHQGVPRRHPAVRHRRAHVAGDVVPRRHPGHRPATPRDRLLSLTPAQLVYRASSNPAKIASVRIRRGGRSGGLRAPSRRGCARRRPAR